VNKCGFEMHLVGIFPTASVLVGNIPTSIALCDFFPQKWLPSVSPCRPALMSALTLQPPRVLRQHW
jgi:hypothetical protein